MKRQIKLLLGSLLLAVSGSTLAATISFSDSIPRTTTNSTDSVSIGLFDTTLGNLQSIDFSLTGIIDGEAGAESRDNRPTTVSLTLGGTITLQRPDSSTLVAVLPSLNRVFNATAYDGVTDFMGGSGETFLGLNTSASNSATLAPVSAADLALFAAPGGGLINLPVVAVASSTGSGAGNLITQFSTDAAARVEVTYTFETTQVPTPTGLLLMGIGLTGLGLVRRLKA